MTVTVEVGELEHGVEIPVTAETAFPIGLISKAWTATLTMILAADGDLELDATLDEYLPELDDLVGLLTLCQLLNLTSGFADMPELCTLSPGRYVRAMRCLRRTSEAGYAPRLGPSGSTCCRDHFFVDSARPDLLRLVASELESAQGGAARVIR